MFEHMTYTRLMDRVLGKVPSDVDKRQGSIIWDALAPACAELAQMYIELDNILTLTYAETSYGAWLDKRCREMGVHRQPATRAVRLGLMYGSKQTLMDVPIGARFSIETLNYVVTEKIDAGQYQLTCEQPGKLGNHLFGRLIPIQTITGLAYAELQDVLVPGEEEEDDTALYARYVEKVNTTPYGGNIADYKQKVNPMDGVGGCKVYPVWQGGGTVRVSLISADFTSPSQTLIENVQEKLDPEPYGQQGLGVAPIGHLVTVTGVRERTIDIETRLTIKTGFEARQYLEDVREAAAEYLLELARDWAGEAYLVVRINQLESRLLSIEGVLDIEGTTLNGGTGNIILGTDEIPVLGNVALNE